MEIVSKVCLNHMKTKHSSPVCRADRWLSYGGSTGGCCGRSRKAQITAYLSVATWEFREVTALKPLLTGNEPYELSQSEVSAEEVVEQINKLLLTDSVRNRWH